MPFAAIGTALGATAATATMTGVAATVGAVGLGMSAAGAAGAFGSSVDQSGPTMAEQEAARAARQTYNLGRKIQVPLDAMARKDLAYLGSGQALDAAGSEGVNQMWREIGPVGQQLAPVANMSGGPGSGRWMNQLSQGTLALSNGAQAANVQGRLGGMNQYLARQGQFLGRRTGDLQAGLGAMTSGGAMAAQNQAMARQAQIQNNIAANQAMGQLGGTMVGIGMSGVSAGLGGAAGAAGATPPGAIPSYAATGYPSIR